MTKRLLAICLLIPALAYSFTYKNNAQTGKPDLVTTSVTDLTDLATGYVPYSSATKRLNLHGQPLVNVDKLSIGSALTPDILMRIVGDNGTYSRIAMRGYSDNAVASNIRVTKFRGTEAVPLTLLSGDSLGMFQWAGYSSLIADGVPGAYIEGNTTQDWTATHNGAKLTFKVTANDAVGPTTALTIDQDKSATFANTVTATTFIGALTGIASGNLVSGGALGTPSSCTLTNCTFPTLNQNTTGTAGGLTGTPNISVGTVTSTGITLNSTTQLTGYKEGTWSVTPTNLTVVGTPTYVGTYTRIGNTVYCNLNIQSTTSTASTLSSTYFNLPYNNSTVETITGYNAAAGAALTNGIVFSNKAYSPTWSASTYVVLSFTYKTTDAF